MLRSLPLLLLLPAVAFAQTSELVTKVEAKLDAERTAQRTEDVEVLRRLLNKACGLPNEGRVTSATQTLFDGISYDPTRIGTAQLLPPADSSLGSRPHANAVGPFDGVYLPGAGVVFTLHVPAGAGTVTDDTRLGLNQSCRTCHSGATVIDPRPVSTEQAALNEWERTRQDVRGEKPKSADPTPKKEKIAVCEPGSLSTQVAAVLASNAKNVRHLPEKEGITVVVTFDDVNPAAGKVFKVSRYYEPVETIEKGQPTTKYELRTKEEWVDADPNPTPGATDGKAFTPAETQKLTLGDLHLKQGKHKEACEAYGEALARFWAKEFKITLRALPPEQRNKYADELQKGVRDAMKNYAKALLLADQPERAKEALEMATGFIVLEVTPTTVPAKNTAPAKLLVSVTKADIDAAKDAAAVKKAVKAERVNFPDVKK